MPQERPFRIVAFGPGGEVIDFTQGETAHRQMIADALGAGIRASCAIEGIEVDPNIDPRTIPESLLVTPPPREFGPTQG
jgi:hypothetical protein